MSALIVVLRTVSLLALAGLLLLGGVGGRRANAKAPARRRDGNRAAVVANLASSGLFFPSLLIWTGGAEGMKALLLAGSGSVVAVAGGVLVWDLTFGGSYARYRRQTRAILPGLL